MSNNGWIAVDLDGTLAEYTGWVSSIHIGPPVPLMLERVKNWLAMGKDVRIFTARIYPINDVLYGNAKRPEEGTWIERSRLDDAWDAVHAIQRWCLQHLGVVIPITNVKDFSMVTLYDDRCVQVIPNTGELVEKGTVA